MSDFSMDMCAFFALSRRSVKIFLRDRANLFFSVLTPLIVFALFLLFLGDVQTAAVLDALPPGTETDGSVKAFVGGWLISGVIGSSCVTVPVCAANAVIVPDRERGLVRDLYASPVKKWVISAGYISYIFIASVIICTLLFAICLVYLAATGAFMLTFADAAEAYGVMILSLLSGTMFAVTAARLFTTASSYSGLIGILSALTGFLIGAYMPISSYPAGVREVVCFVPAAHAAALLRNAFMRAALGSLGSGLPAAFSQSMSDAFSLTLSFAGNEIPAYFECTVLAISVVLFFAIGLLIRRKHTK